MSDNDDGAAQPVDLDDIKPSDRSIELSGSQKQLSCRTEEEVASPLATPEGLLFDPFVFGNHLSFFNGAAVYKMFVVQRQSGERNFTWSNNRANPTLTRIDKMFYTLAWGQLFLSPIVQALSPSTSDHCPLVLMPYNPPTTRPIFRFESFWPSKLGFFIVFKMLGARRYCKSKIPLVPYILN
jgi:hypothetical protein